MNHNENFMNWRNPGSALITGASAGLGAEFARQLAGQGFKTILVARRTKKLEAVSEEILEKYAGKVDILTADLTNPADNEKVMSLRSRLSEKILTNI